MTFRLPTQQHALSSAGPTSSQLRDLWWMYSTFLAVALVLVVGLVIVAVWRSPRRERLDQGATPSTHTVQVDQPSEASSSALAQAALYHKHRLVIAITVLTLLTLFALFVASVTATRALDDAPAPHAARGPRGQLAALSRAQDQDHEGR